MLARNISCPIAHSHLLVRMALVLMAVCVASGTARAERVVDLFEYSVVVDSQSQTDLRQAVSDGFAEVLVRASGQAEILTKPNVLSELRRADGYKLSHRYDKATIDTVNSNGTTTSKQAWRLVVKYSGPMVQNLLRQLQLPIWPPRRPNTLLWLVVDRGAEGRQFVSATQLPELLQAVNASAVRRGLPVDFPLLDLEDQVALPADRVWRLDEEQIVAASQRYNPDSILVGRLTQSSQSDWRSAWTLIHKNRTEVFDNRNSDANSLIAGVMDQVANFYVSQYAIAPGSGGSVIVDVGGVDSFAKYVDVLKYLQDLAIVRDVSLIEVNGDHMYLNIYTEGERKLFEDTLALGNKLKIDTSPVSGGVNPEINMLRLYVN